MLPGIDAGSTTTKVALVARTVLCFTIFTAATTEAPATAIASIKEIKALLPETAKIAYSCSTGYGEALLKAAFLLDEGEVETISHTMPQPSSIRRWTVSWTSAART